MKDDNKIGPQGEILIYQTEKGETGIEVRLEDETVWMAQAGIAELYGTSPQNITMHIRNIFQEGELDEEATCKNYLQVQKEGERDVKRNIRHYNLEVILAVGYRVRSERGTQFRKWATNTVKEYLVKGFVMNDERLKDPGGWDYFDELLKRIREIRASEKRFYQKVRDIYALSTDYDPRSDTAKLFFQKVQNKMLWAITGHTAAELIAERSDPTKPNMGLTTWKGNRVRKGDIDIAKNYLEQPEIDELNRIVVMYLDYAEDQASRRKAMYMRDWEDKLDAFLEFNDRNVLDHAGKLRADVAKKLASERYEKFDRERKKREAQQADDESVEELKQIEESIRRKKK